MVSTSLMASESCRNRRRPPDDFYTPFVMTSPRETLSLIWLVCGPNSSGSFYEISKIIDRLIKADPDIEVDRRLQ